MGKAAVVSCGNHHVFCKSCLDDMKGAGGTGVMKCPSCRGVLRKKDARWYWGMTANEIAIEKATRAQAGGDVNIRNGQQETEEVATCTCAPGAEEEDSSGDGDDTLWGEEEEATFAVEARQDAEYQAVYEYDADTSVENAAFIAPRARGGSQVASMEDDV
jgi:hypothetical protein